jgi:ATP-dependent DNA helicase RecQ
MGLRAAGFLRRLDLLIPPRKRWPGRFTFEHHRDWSGYIDEGLRAEEGRALSQWGDAGYGVAVRRGKAEGRFAEELVEGVAEMLSERWQPSPAPAWVTCVPSHNRPELVPGFARRLAAALDLPFVPCVQKTRTTAPQKEQENSQHRARNIDGAFAVEPSAMPGGPTLLVDDAVDSGWTLAVVGALLREAGSGPVFPLALASTGARAQPAPRA